MKELPYQFMEFLYRRSFASPEKKYMNPDGTATSRAFKLRERDRGELSVDVVSLTTPQKSINDPARYYLFNIANEVIKSLELETFHDKLDDGTNDAHAVILGLSIDDDIKPGIMARKSKRVFL